MRKRWRDLYRKRWDHVSLAEIQLLLQGLWIIGEQNRVDLKLLTDYGRLHDQLRVAGDMRIREAAPKEGGGT